MFHYLTLLGAVLDFLAAAALFHLLKLLEATAALLHRDSDFGLLCLSST